MKGVKKFGVVVLLEEKWVKRPTWSPLGTSGGFWTNVLRAPNSPTAKDTQTLRTMLDGWLVLNSRRHRHTLSSFLAAAHGPQIDVRLSFFGRKALLRDAFIPPSSRRSSGPRSRHFSSIALEFFSSKRNDNDDDFLLRCQRQIFFPKNLAGQAISSQSC